MNIDEDDIWGAMSKMGLMLMLVMHVIYNQCVGERAKRASGSNTRRGNHTEY